MDGFTAHRAVVIEARVAYGLADNPVPVPLDFDPHGYSLILYVLSIENVLHQYYKSFRRQKE